MYKRGGCALLWLSHAKMAVVRTVEVASAGRTLAACGAITGGTLTKVWALLEHSC